MTKMTKCSRCENKATISEQLFGLGIFPLCDTCYQEALKIQALLDRLPQQLRDQVYKAVEDGRWKDLVPDDCHRSDDDNEPSIDKEET